MGLAYRELERIINKVLINFGVKYCNNILTLCPCIFAWDWHTNKLTLAPAAVIWTFTFSA
jgi:hypothetical protein